MNILAVDDERPALRILSEAIKEVVPGCELYACTKGQEALELAQTVTFDIAFPDAKIPGITGLERALLLKRLHGKTNIIFVTSYSDYMREAFAMHVSGYLMKPVTAQAVQRELENLRHPVERPMEALHQAGLERIIIRGRNSTASQLAALAAGNAATRRLVANPKDLAVDAKNSKCFGDFIMILQQNIEFRGTSMYCTLNEIIV